MSSAHGCNGFPNVLDFTLEFGVGAKDRLMRYPPDWFERGGIVCQAWDEMPMYMRQLIAEEFVVDLLGPIDLRKGLGDLVHFFHQLHPFLRRQVEELCRVALKDEDGPAGEELILMEVGLRTPEICDEMVGSRPGPCAGLARRIGHGRLALRHSSSVNRPFLINN